MCNKRNLTVAVINEKLLIKSMKPIFITVTILTVLIFPVIFLMLYKNQPDMCYGNIMEISQYCFPFFSSLLTVFVVRNYIEHYHCEIYFLYSKTKIKESLLILLVYLIELIFPLLTCVYIEHNMIYEFIRVFCQCAFFSALAYSLVFITMSVPMTVAALFIYLIVSIYNMGDYLKIFIFCSYEEMNSGNIIKTVLQLIISAFILYIVGIISNLFRSKRYCSIL